MTHSYAPGRAAAFVAMLAGFAVSSAVGPIACQQDPLEQCQGNIEVNCNGEDDCWCGTGAYEGQSCIYELNSTDPEVCEMKCCGAGGVPGPPSILRGTR